MSEKSILKKALEHVERARALIEEIEDLDTYSEQFEIENLANDTLYDIAEEIKLLIWGAE